MHIDAASVVGGGGGGKQFVVVGCRKPAYVNSTYDYVELTNNVTLSELFAAPKSFFDSTLTVNPKYACNKDTGVWTLADAANGGGYLTFDETKQRHLDKQTKKSKSNLVGFGPLLDEKGMRGLLAKAKGGSPGKKEAQEVVDLVHMVIHYPWYAQLQSLIKTKNSVVFKAPV